MSPSTGDGRRLTKSVIEESLDPEYISSDVIQSENIQQVDEAVKEPVQRSSSARNLILKLFDRENNAKDNLPAIDEHDLVSFNPDVVASVRKYDKERLEQRPASIDFELKQHKTKLQKLKDIVARRYRRVSNLHIRFRNSQYFAPPPITFVELTDESSDIMLTDAGGQAQQSTAPDLTDNANNIVTKAASVGMALPIYAQMSKPNDDACVPASHSSIRRRTLGPSLRSENQDQHGLHNPASNKISRMNSSPVLGLPGSFSRSSQHSGANRAFPSELFELADARLETTQAAEMVSANLETTKRPGMRQRKSPGLPPALAAIAAVTSPAATSPAAESGSSITAYAPSVSAAGGTDQSGDTSALFAADPAEPAFATNHAISNTVAAKPSANSGTSIATHAFSGAAAGTENQTAQSSSLVAGWCAESTSTANPVTSTTAAASSAANPPIPSTAFSAARPLGANQSTSSVTRAPFIAATGSAISALASPQTAPAVPHADQAILSDRYANSAKHWLPDNDNVSDAPRSTDKGLIRKTTQSPAGDTGSSVFKSLPLTNVYSALDRIATFANQVKGVQPGAQMQTQGIQPALWMHARDFQPASQMHNQCSRLARQMRIQGSSPASQMHIQGGQPAAQMYVPDPEPTRQMQSQALQSAPQMYDHMQTTALGQARSCLASCRHAQMMGAVVHINPLVQHPVLLPSALSEQQADMPIASPQLAVDNPPIDGQHVTATPLPSTPDVHFSAMAEVFGGPEIEFLAANPSSPRSAAMAYRGGGRGFTTPEPSTPPGKSSPKQ